MEAVIRRLRVHNFKSLHEIDVELERLTMIVGPNGCGKSSVLQAIGLACEYLRAPDWEQVRFSSNLISRRESSETPGSIVIELETLTDKDPLIAHLELTADESGQSLDEGASKVDLRPPSPYPFMTKIPSNSSLTNTLLYRLERNVMERPAYSEETSPTLGPHGENLAAVLDALHGAQPERFEAVEQALREMVPGFRRLRLPRAKLAFTRKALVGDEYRPVKDSVVGHQVVFDFDYADGVVAEQASEGTLLLLGLLTILATHTGPMTMMLDDLDRALHPKAQKQLVEHLRQLIDEREDLQILATSHSPYLVEHLKYEEVLAMTQSPADGRSHIAPLLDHPDAERWREEMSAGEFGAASARTGFVRPRPDGQHRARLRNRPCCRGPRRRAHGTVPHRSHTVRRGRVDRRRAGRAPANLAGCRAGDVAAAVETGSPSV